MTTEQFEQITIIARTVVGRFSLSSYQRDELISEAPAQVYMSMVKMQLTGQTIKHFPSWSAKVISNHIKDSLKKNVDLPSEDTIFDSAVVEEQTPVHELVELVETLAAAGKGERGPSLPDHLIKSYLLLRSGGYTKQECAELLNCSSASLTNAEKRMRYNS